MVFRQNIMLNTDSYKVSHWKQYPPETKYVSNYIESRDGRWNRTPFFGLQMFLKEYLTSPITQEQINIANEIWESHGLPFNKDGWQYILEKHGGYLPLFIEALAEGTVIETGNVLVQVQNTDPNCWWLPGYMETAILRAVWYPTTVCTSSYMCKQIIRGFLEATSDHPEEELLFKLHDFGFRGVSSYESGMIGGVAHLVNFRGSDTIAGVLAAREYYHEPMAGFSIPASEHSTITSWGQENEIKAYNNLIHQFAGEGKMYACVSDSYDIYNAVEVLWPALKESVKSLGGTLVVRPDSGNPIAVVSGVIERLLDKFGFAYNSKGYKVLPDYIRTIQGDGLDEKTIHAILQELKFRKISASNISFGMGGALLQHLERDTLRFAMKCSAIQIGSQLDFTSTTNSLKKDNWIDVYKNPITDQNKKSKRGRLALRRNKEGFETIREDLLGNSPNYLEPVYRNGELLRDQTFAEIRSLAQ